MKANYLRAVIIAATLTSASFAGNLSAAPTHSIAVRVGVYDSRVVAYAWFTSSAHMRELNNQIQDAKNARASGDTQRLHELRATLRQTQKQIMLEVFSTAPANEALVRIKTRLPAIESAAGVAALVSKWDNTGLKKYSGAEQLDVTGQLAREFNPNLTEKQLKTIAALEKNKPLPLFWCKLMMRP